MDEGDLIEFDAGYAYVLNDSGLVIVDTWPAEELEVVSRFDVAGRPIGIYLDGDRLTIISQTGGYPVYPWYYRGTTNDSISMTDAWYPPGYWNTAPAETIVTVLDVSDRTAPEVVQTTKMEGRYIDSRSVDGVVYTLLSNAQAAAPRPEVIDDDGDPATIGRYETAEEYAARLSANRGEVIEAALPSYTTTGPDGELVRTGLLATPERIHTPLTADADSLLSIVSIDAHSDEAGLMDSTALYSTGAGTVYASLDNFYVFDTDYSQEDGAVTRVTKFNWDPATGGIDLAATTTVPGIMINQFAADEQGDLLRITTTASNSRSGNWSGRDENLLFVLREDGGVMESVGSIQNWALNENIRSVRFLGDRAFVTTFRQVDPLFALDLTDPSQPVAVGHVTLPGFTSYMHLVDQNHLLAVGKNTPNGWAGPTQVSLFDISDLKQPLRIAEHTFSRFSTSEAQIDHHAFAYFAEHGLMTMPVVSRHVERTDADGDGYSETRQWVTDNRLAVFTVDVTAANPADHLVLSAEIEHDAAVRRSGYIGDKLYSIGRDAIKVVDVTDLEAVLAEAALSEPPIVVTIGPYQSIDFLDTGVRAVTLLTDFPPADPLAESIAAVRRHLAERLGVAVGAPLLVTSEATPDAPGGGAVVAMRVEGEDYYYRISVGGRFEAVSAGYGYDPEAGAWQALQSPLTPAPTGAPGDYNHDGQVDQTDYQAWRGIYGQWSLTTYLAADGNLDGVVDAADYTVWREHLTGPEEGPTAAPQAAMSLDQAFALFSSRVVSRETSHAPMRSRPADPFAGEPAHEARALLLALDALGRLEGVPKGRLPQADWRSDTELEEDLTQSEEQAGLDAGVRLIDRAMNLFSRL